MVNNAGIYIPKPLLETDAALFERHMRVNQLGCFLGMKAVAGLMERSCGGSIVNISSVAGLRGYVGVDLVLGDQGDWVIEINPRLTTSYIGLRTLTNDNLAVAMLRIALGQPPGNLTWRKARVRFHADGRTEHFM